MGGANDEDQINNIKLLFNKFTINIQKLDSNDNNKIFNKLNKPIPECCQSDITYLQILEKLSDNFEKPIFIVGGAVRDFMKTKNTDNMNDIDINYTIDPSKIESLLSNLNINHYFKDDRNYIRIGPKTRADYLEGFYITNQTYNPNMMECKMNSLMFTFINNQVYFIDLFNGEGLYQAINNIWEAPTIKYDEWFNNQPKLLWRLLKFELRGYIVPVETKKAVYNYWIINNDKIKDYYWENMWWTLSPDNIQNIINLIIKDCNEININPVNIIKIFIDKKLLIANKK
jgi:hypothetical protein